MSLNINQHVINNICVDTLSHLFEDKTLAGFWWRKSWWATSIARSDTFPRNHFSFICVLRTVVKISLLCSFRVCIYWQEVTESTISNFHWPEQNKNKRPKQRSRRLELETNECVLQFHIYETRARIRPATKRMIRNGNKNSSVGLHKTIPPIAEVPSVQYANKLTKSAWYWQSRLNRYVIHCASNPEFHSFSLPSNS